MCFTVIILRHKECAKFVRNAVRISKRRSASCKLTFIRSCAAITRLCRMSFKDISQTSKVSWRISFVFSYNMGVRKPGSFVLNLRMCFNNTTTRLHFDCLLGFSRIDSCWSPVGRLSVFENGFARLVIIQQ